MINNEYDGQLPMMSGLKGPKGPKGPKGLKFRSGRAGRNAEKLLTVWPFEGLICIGLPDVRGIGRPLKLWAGAGGCRQFRSRLDHSCEWALPMQKSGGFGA